MNTQAILLLRRQIGYWFFSCLTILGLLVAVGAGFEQCLAVVILIAFAGSYVIRQQLRQQQIMVLARVRRQNSRRR